MEDTTSSDDWEETHGGTGHASDPVGGNAGGASRAESDRGELQGATDPAEVIDANSRDGVDGSGPFPGLGNGSGEALTGVQRAELIAQHYSGPLPDPSAFAAYDSVLPGAADRILAMAEQRQANELEMQMTTTRAEARSFLGASWAVAFFPWGLAIITAGLLVAGENASASITGLATAFTAGPQIIAAARPRKQNQER